MTHDLETTLDQMHAAILAADFKGLSRMLPALQVAEEQMQSQGLANPGTIREKAARNATCLQASLQGVKAARRRLTDIADAAKGLTTYDKTGGKAVLPAFPSKPRRA